MEDGIGNRPSPGRAYLDVVTSSRGHRRLFLIALERGFLDSILDRLVVEPFTRLARRLTRLDRWLCDVVLPAGRRLRSRRARRRMSDVWVLLGGLVVPPAFVIGASLQDPDVERLRRLAVAAAVAMLLASLIIAVSPGRHEFAIRSSRSPGHPEEKPSSASTRSRSPCSRWRRACGRSP